MCKDFDKLAEPRVEISKLASIFLVNGTERQVEQQRQQKQQNSISLFGKLSGSMSSWKYCVNVLFLMMPSGLPRNQNLRDQASCTGSLCLSLLIR